MADILANGSIDGAVARPAPRSVSRARRASVRSARRHRGSSEFWFYVAITFPFFLAIALASRLMPRSWRPFPTETDGRRRSVIGDAKAAAYTMLPFVFMA